MGTATYGGQTLPADMGLFLLTSAAFANPLPGLSALPYAYMSFCWFRRWRFLPYAFSPHAATSFSNITLYFSSVHRGGAWRRGGQKVRTQGAFGQRGMPGTPLVLGGTPRARRACRCSACRALLPLRDLT